MAELKELEYINRLTAEDIYNFWRDNFVINKNKDLVSTVRKGWLYIIARKYTDISIDSLATVFNTTSRIITVTSNEMLRNISPNSLAIDYTLREINYWKYKRSNQ